MRITKKKEPIGYQNVFNQNTCILKKMQKKIREIKMFLTGGKLKCQFYVRIKIEEGLWFRIVTNFLYISMTNTATCWCKSIQTVKIIFASQIGYWWLPLS